MNKFLRTGILLAALCFCVNFAKAQVGFDYAQYDFGLGTGINTVYGDAETFIKTQSYHVNLTYNISPYINYVFEVQGGQLKGGDSLKTLSGRQFVNQFTAVMMRGQIQAGEIMDYSDSRLKNALKNFYVSAGLGFIVNHITSISRYSTQLPGFYTPGDNNSNEVMVPLRLGYEFKLFNQYDQPSFKVDLGYQYNLIMGDGLDGYTVGSKKDAYSQITIGVKFALGGVTSYRKQVRY